MNLRPFGVFLAATLAFGPSLSAQDTSSSGITASLDSLLDLRISSASKYAQTTKEAAASVTIISSEEIEAFGYRTLYEALTTVRGFYGSSDRNYFYMGLRGFSRPTDYNNRILLMLNGDVLNENIYMGFNPNMGLGLEMESVERVEVVRGPASAIYGGSAVLGVVNVVTKSASGDRELRAEGGGAGFRRLGASVSEIFDGTEVTLRAHWFDSDGGDLYSEAFDSEETNNGVAAGLDWENGYGFGGSARHGGLTLDLSGASRSKGIPTAPWETTFNDGRASTVDSRFSANLQHESTLGEQISLTVSTFFDLAAYEGVYPYVEDDGGLFEDLTQGRWHGMRTHATWDVSPRSRLLLGAEWVGHQKVRIEAEDEEDGQLLALNPTHSVLSIYAQNELALSAHATFLIGARLDDYTDFDPEVNPRVALLLHPTQSTTFKFLYGEAFRAPSRWEAFYEEEGYHKRNTALMPERIGTLEVVAEQRLRAGLLASMSLYSYRMKDLIDETEDPVDGVATYENLSSAEAHGLELGIRGRLSEDAGGYANLVIQRTVDDTDSRLSNSPPVLMRAGAHVRLYRSLRVGTEILYDGERKTLFGTTLDSSVRTNLTLSTDELFGRVRASITARNLFDTSYAVPGGWEHTQEAITQMGRTVRLGVSLLF